MSKRIIEDSLPIKCLEAVILSIYLTNEIPLSVNGLEKFTIGFKTTSKGNVHRHVVLGVYCHGTGLFGALGISRRSDLGYKKLKFKSLNDLLLDYIDSYSNYLHKVKRIKIGNPIAGSNRSFETIPWNGCTINVASQNASDWPKLVEKHSRTIRHHSSMTLSSMKANTSLSLRNLTNLNIPLMNKKKSKSYLDIHLDDLKQKELNKSSSKSESVSNHMNTLGEEDEDDYYDSDDDFKSRQQKSLSYFPQTAPNFSRTKKNSESLTSLSLISSDKKNQLSTGSFYTTSGSLLNRKKRSIRI